jgi:PAS domain-containing protein
MTAHGHDHSQVLAAVCDQFRDVLDGSAQGMYIFLDEQHKVCNQRFAAMLGYDSPAAWDQTGSFTDLYVNPRSQMDLVSAYRRAMEQQVGSSIEVTWKSRQGTPVPTTVILVPIAYGGELLALHFVSPT